MAHYPKIVLSGFVQSPLVVPSGSNWLLTSDGTPDGIVGNSGLTYTNKILSVDGAFKVFTGYTGNTAIAQLQWDSGNGTFVYLDDAGDETFVDQQSRIKIYNDAGVTMVKGDLVYVTGSQGNRPKCKLAIATADTESSVVLGMVVKDIPNGDEGFITTNGMMYKLNTNSFTGGTALWLSPTTPGKFTSTKPVAPNHNVLIGYVVRVSSTVGSVFVNIQNGYEIDELHNVRITSIQNGDLLWYNTSAGYWENTKILTGDYEFIGDQIIDGDLDVNVNSTFNGSITALSDVYINTIPSGTSNDFLIWNSSTKQVERRSGGAGTSGTSGISGSSGTSGTSGISGSAGTSGTSGTSGISGSSGSSGTSGISGSSGTSGTSGIAGFRGGLDYNFSTTTTDADPGTGVFRYNSSSIGSVSKIFIDNTDINSQTLTAFFNTWDDSSTPIRGILTIQGRTSSVTTINTFLVTAVAAATGYYKIDVVYVSGSLPANNAQMSINFTRTGDKGDQGAQGDPGTSAPSVNLCIASGSFSYETTSTTTDFFIGNPDEGWGAATRTTTFGGGTKIAIAEIINSIKIPFDFASCNLNLCFTAYNINAVNASNQIYYAIWAYTCAEVLANDGTWINDITQLENTSGYFTADYISCFSLNDISITNNLCDHIVLGFTDDCLSGSNTKITWTLYLTPTS